MHVCDKVNFKWRLVITEEGVTPLLKRATQESRTIVNTYDQTSDHPRSTRQTLLKTK